MALADLDPPAADRAAAGRFARPGDAPDAAASGRFARPGDAPDAAASGRFARPDGAREGEAAERVASVSVAPEPLAVPPSTRDAEVRRAARARQAVVARWLRQLSR